MRNNVTPCARIASLAYPRHTLLLTMAASSRLPFAYISGEEVKQLINMSELIEEMSRGLQWVSARSEGGVVQPVRSMIRVEQYSGNFATMPAYSSRSNSLGAKIVSFYSQQIEGLPSHQAIVMVFDPRTGSLQAIVDGVVITNMRTAAVSACAVKALLTQPPSVLCIVGSGVQARSHVEPLRIHHNFTDVRVWGRTITSAKACADEVGAQPYTSLPDALNGADVVVTVTMATKPLVHGEWLKTGAVVVSVGACRSDWRELDDDIMHNSLVIVDSREGALKEAGDVILSKVEIFAEIGEILSGDKPLPSLSDCGKKFIVFKSLGMAIEDVLTGSMVYDRFIKRMKTA